MISNILNLSGSETLASLPKWMLCSFWLILLERTSASQNVQQEGPGEDRAILTDWTNDFTALDVLYHS
jgi:hypothetical protein